MWGETIGSVLKIKIEWQRKITPLISLYLFLLNQEETKIKTTYIKYIENFIGGGILEFRPFIT